MKNNTSDLKSCLQQALRIAPNDFSLQEVKGLIARALSVVEGVEKKRSLREQNKADRVQQKLQPIQNPLNVLQNIENELTNQKKKLEEIRKRKSPMDAIEDEELQNVFG